MGRRSPAETVARILVAFLQSRTWRQKDLADHCELTPPTLRKRLVELEAGGMPLCRDEDDGVFWSVPAGWFPEGALLKASETAQVARLVARLPKAPERERVLRTLLLGGEPPNAPGNEATEVGREGVLAALEDAARGRWAVRLRYDAVSRGDRSERAASVQRIVYGAHARFVAVCHRADALKWFRVDRTESVSRLELEGFRERDDVAIDAFVAASLGGFHNGTPVACSVFVRDPEARWVVHNLPQPMAVQQLVEGARIQICTAGLDVLARFVVGLGEAARAETPELRARVIRLAQGALDANLAVRKVNTRSVARKRTPSYGSRRR